jgi:hypothetical protein
MKRAAKCFSVVFLIGVVFLAAWETPCKAAAKKEQGEPDPNAVIIQKERGLLDWSRNYIEATGLGVVPKGSTGAQGKALARRGAIVDLQRNLLEFLSGVQVDARTTMNDFMAEDRVRTEVHGMIRNIELLEGEWDGESYTVSGRVKLPQILVVVAPAIEAKAPKASPQPSAPKTSGRFTGLVLDARHLSIVPCLSFRLIDEGGREVYGLNFADPKFYQQSGLATYYNNLDYAKGEIRVAANPIVAKAIRVTDSGDIVIPNSAASRMRGSSYDFRKECKVIIVCK